jgi:hypothetical protein
MIKKFNEFANEGIRDTFNKVKTRLKEYTDAEPQVEEPGLTTFSRDIELDTEFEDRISEEEYFELERSTTYVKYDKNEINQLNLFFGVANPNEYDLGKYFFSVKNKIFGQPMKTFKGTIDKKKIAETKEIIYLINMYIEVKTRESRGSDWVVLKYDALEDAIKFLDTIIEK